MWPSFILICPTILPQYTNITDGRDRIDSSPIAVAQKSTFYTNKTAEIVGKSKKGQHPLTGQRMPPISGGT